jgi:alpha-D-xyloside xylohydrolase
METWRMRPSSRNECIAWPGFQAIRTPHKGTVLARTTTLIMLMVAAGAGAQNQASRFVIEQNDRTIVLEPYADNIVRITLSTEKTAALGAPGYGIVGTPSMTGWAEERESDGSAVVRSGRMTVRVAPENLPPPHAFPLDTLNQSLRDHYFGGANAQGPMGRPITG